MLLFSNFCFRFRYLTNYQTVAYASLCPADAWVSSGAAAVVDHHGRDLSVDDLLLAVEVEHVDG